MTKIAFSDLQTALRLTRGARCQHCHLPNATVPCFACRKVCVSKRVTSSQHCFMASPIDSSIVVQNYHFCCSLAVPCVFDRYDMICRDCCLRESPKNVHMGALLAR